jgi:hypothetical protein
LQNNVVRAPRLFLGSVDQTEDVVQDEEAALSIGLEVEALGVAHGLRLFIDLFHGVSIGGDMWMRDWAKRTYNKTTGNQDSNASLAGGLGVQGGNLVAHLLEGKALLIGHRD